MLADDAAVRAVFLEGGLLGRTSTSPTHINMATISVALADEMAEQHKARNIAYMAAPIMGRPDVAAAAKLTIIAAGPANAVAQVQPLLDALGARTWNAGETPSHANLMKLAANLLLASAIETLAETAVLLSEYGVEPGGFVELIATSSFQGPVYGTYGRLIAERQYEPAAFKARLALKDVRLALAAADARSIQRFTVACHGMLPPFARGRLNRNGSMDRMCADTRWLVATGGTAGRIHHKSCRAAIVNALGPIRQIVQGESQVQRRYLAVVPSTAHDHGAPVQVQVRK